MKKVVLSIVFVTSLTVFVSCKKESAKAKIKKENLLNAEKRDKEAKGSPIVSFNKEVHDFGTVDEGEVIETSFIVTNSGESDLLIMKAEASCGCTVPTFSKEPIPPNKTGEIKVKFDTNGQTNKQSKTITITTNTIKGKETVRVSGMVKPKNKK